MMYAINTETSGTLTAEAASSIAARITSTARARAREELRRMQRVGLPIGEIVEDVDHRCRHAEHQRAEQREQSRALAGEQPGEDERRQNEEILDPVPGSQQLDEGHRSGARHGGYRKLRGHGSPLPTMRSGRDNGDSHDRSGAGER